MGFVLVLPNSENFGIQGNDQITRCLTGGDDPCSPTLETSFCAHLIASSLSKVGRKGLVKVGALPLHPEPAVRWRVCYVRSAMDRTGWDPFFRSLQDGTGGFAS